MEGKRSNTRNYDPRKAPNEGPGMHDFYEKNGVDGPSYHNYQERYNADMVYRKMVEDEEEAVRASIQKKEADETASQMAPNASTANLTINTPGDQFELEADALADKVTGSKQSKTPNSTATKHPSEIQAKGNTLAPPSGFESKLNATKGGGEPLPADFKSKMEGHTGTDLSGVRLHTDSNAAGMATDIKAEAFTHGQDIYGPKEKLDPGNSDSEHTLAHEVGHTLQQSRGTANGLIQRDPSEERLSTTKTSIQFNLNVPQGAVGKAEESLLVLLMQVFNVSREDAIAVHPLQWAGESPSGFTKAGPQTYNMKAGNYFYAKKRFEEKVATPDFSALYELFDLSPAWGLLPASSLIKDVAGRLFAILASYPSNYIQQIWSAYDRPNASGDRSFWPDFEMLLELSFQKAAGPLYRTPPYQTFGDAQRNGLFKTEKGKGPDYFALIDELILLGSAEPENVMIYDGKTRDPSITYLDFLFSPVLPDFDVGFPTESTLGPVYSTPTPVNGVAIQGGATDAVTVGHTTNYMMEVVEPADKERSPKVHWFVVSDTEQIQNVFDLSTSPVEEYSGFSASVKWDKPGLHTVITKVSFSKGSPEAKYYYTKMKVFPSIQEIADAAAPEDLKDLRNISVKEDVAMGPIVNAERLSLIERYFTHSRYQTEILSSGASTGRKVNNLAAHYFTISHMMVELREEMRAKRVYVNSQVYGKQATEYSKLQNQFYEQKIDAEYEASRNGEIEVDSESEFTVEDYQQEIVGFNQEFTTGDEADARTDYYTITQPLHPLIKEFYAILFSGGPFVSGSFHQFAYERGFIYLDEAWMAIRNAPLKIERESDLNWWRGVISSWVKVMHLLDIFLVEKMKEDNEISDEQANMYQYQAHVTVEAEKIYASYPNAIAIPAMYYPAVQALTPKQDQTDHALPKDYEPTGMRLHLYLYYNEIEESWDLYDTVSRHRVYVDAKDGENEPSDIGKLFKKLGKDSAFPDGVIKLEYPKTKDGVTEHQRYSIAIKDSPWTFGDWLKAIGIAGAVVLALVSKRVPPTLLTRLGMFTTGLILAGDIINLVQGWGEMEFKEKAISFLHIAMDLTLFLMSSSARVLQMKNLRGTALESLAGQSYAWLEGFSLAAGTATMIVGVQEVFDQFHSLTTTVKDKDQLRYAQGQLLMTFFMMGALHMVAMRGGWRGMANSSTIRNSSPGTTSFHAKFQKYLSQFKNSVTNPGNRTKVWRVLRPNQNTNAPLVPKNKTGLTKKGEPFTIDGHVRTGSRNETPYISSFTNKEDAMARGLKDGNTVVEIDLTKVNGQFFDLTNSTVRNTVLGKGPLRNFAKASSEFVIVTDHIPVSAYKVVK